MSIPQSLIRAIIYEKRRGSGATEAWKHQQRIGRVHYFHQYCQAMFKGGETKFEDMPTSGRPHAAEDYFVLDAVKEKAEVASAVLRRD